METWVFLFLIFIVAYNAERHIQHVLDRIPPSIYADFDYEILLIDDASTDGSKAIIDRYQDQYPDLIRAFYNSENQGIAKTWVAICQEARGFYIARCDGDDFWLDKQKLQKQLVLHAIYCQALARFMARVKTISN